MVAEAAAWRNRSGGRRNDAERVGLAAAGTAAHGQDRETLARRDPRDDFARLLEADVHLHRETCRAQPAFVPREHATHGGGHALRSLLGAQAGGAQTIETPLVKTLVGESPGERLARTKLLTADGACLGSRARLHVGERRRPQSRRAHVHTSSNADAT